MSQEYAGFVQRLAGTDNWITLEKHRKKAMIERYVGTPILFIILLLISCYTVISGALFEGLACFVVTFALPIYIWRVSHKNYSAEYKKLIMPQLVTDIIKSYEKRDVKGKVTTAVKCKYQQDGHVGEQTLLDFPLFQKYIKERIFAEGEDLFSGFLGSTDFKFSDFTFKHNRKIPFKDQDVDLTEFKGLVFLADFHKAFDGTTMLVTRTGKIYKRLSKTGSRMQSDSVEFERMFKTYTTDEITARYLLPANMMERVIHLRKLFRSKGMVIYLHEGMLLITIHKVDYFESNGLKKLDAGGVKRTYDEIKAIMDIIELLNLNLRIWNKKEKRRR